MTGNRVYALDSEGLSRWVRGERRMGACLRHADDAGIPVVTTSMTLIEAYGPTRRPPQWPWALPKIRVEQVTEEPAKEATCLLRESGPPGHRYAIDAALAAVALRQSGPVTVFTSDEDDMRKLCADRVVVVKL